MDLLRTYLRAEALEALLVREHLTHRVGIGARQTGGAERDLVPALPAAASLRQGTGADGDLFSQRVGSPAAALAFGATPEILLRQALARATAPAQGRDAGGIPTDWDRGWVGPIPLPGALMEVMAGIAMAIRMKGEPRVALLVDDTAGSASGDWHEGLNLAVVREAPLVVVNHEIGEGPRGGAGPGMGERAEAYGFRVWETVDSDPRSVFDTCRDAVEVARSGGGAQVVDVRADPDAEPDERSSRLVGEAGDSPSLDELRAEARAEMEAALEAVALEPDPDPASLLIPSMEAPASPFRSIRRPTA